jgi:hypothetical protein
MKKRGRKALRPSISLMVWVMVELMRDRREAGRERATVRESCKRLEKHLAESMQGGHELRFERLRKHHTKFGTVMQRSDSGALSDLARALLENARQRRDLVGWDNISTWALVIDPDRLEAMGFERDTANSDGAADEVVRFRRRTN